MSSDSLQVSIEHLNELLLVEIVGRLDTVSAPSFDAQIASTLSRPHPHILVDLSQVTYISSAGLRSILQLAKHTAAHAGRVGLFGAQPQILEVIEMSGFPSLLDLYPDRQSALADRSS